MFTKLFTLLVLTFTFNVFAHCGNCGHDEGEECTDCKKKQTKETDTETTDGEKEPAEESN